MSISIKNDLFHKRETQIGHKKNHIHSTP